MVLALFSALPALAIECTVTNTNDSGPGSLRAAIGDSSCTSIVFNLAYPVTITLTSGELAIGRSLTITGPGAENLAISGGNSTRVFYITGASTVVEISGVTIRDGSGPELDGHGGGIYNSGGTLTLTNSTVSGNSALHGGGLYNWGGGTMLLTNSTVSGNYAVMHGGGIVSDQGTLTLTNSTVSGNSSLLHGGGIWVGYDNTSLTLTNSTVSDNSTSKGGGGIAIEGCIGGTATLTNSTVSGNSSWHGGGGIFNWGGSTMLLTNSTVSGNHAVSSGGGILVHASMVYLKNTLLANSSEDYWRNCYFYGVYGSLGYNLSDDWSCDLHGPGDQNNIPAGLDPDGLKDNGGPTQTIALLPSSPAVDAIPEAACTDVGGNPVETDQRGVARPQGDACDIGAFELGPLIQVIIDIKPGSDPNSINLDSAGRIPVAICSSPDFNPMTVDPYSIELASASIALKGKALTPMVSYEYLSVGPCGGDGYPDLVVHVDTENVTLTPDAVEAVVTGTTTTVPPTAIQGVDSVQIVPPAI